MAVYDLEEQEQIDEAKAWWKQHGNKVIWGVTVFLLAIAGWRGWESWKAREGVEAALLFERAAQAASMNDVKAAKEATARIMENQGLIHPGWRPYAAPAAWLAARLNYEANDLKSARAQYEFAMDHARDAGMKQLARLRLAALNFEDKDAAGALALLDEDYLPAFAGLAAQLKGDVLFSQGKLAEARAAYKLALEKLGEKSSLKPLVELRLDALGG